VFVYVLFLVGLLCTVSTAILAESVYIVKQSEHTRAARYAQLIAEQSTALYLLAARSQVSSGGVAGLASGNAWSMHASACDASVANCPYTYDAQVLVGVGTGASASAQQPTNDSAMNLQRSYVGEQRASAQLQITMNDKNGNAVARAMRSLTLRVFNVDPWVIISGNKQYSAHAVDDTTIQGDTGGVPAQPGDPGAPDPNYPNGFRDTRIHVTVQCANDGVGGGTQGNEGTGGVQVSCASAASPAPADAFDPSPRPWHNIGGVGVPAGWSP
jgi:hypothetical protein